MVNLQQVEQKIDGLSSKDVLGCRVNLVSFEGALEIFKRLLMEKKSAHIVTVNSEMIMRAQQDIEFKNILDEADLLIPDGVGVTLALSFLGESQKRIPGIDFSFKALEYCAQNNLKVAFVGAKEEVIFEAKEKLCQKIENLNVVFCHHGYFEDENEVLKKLEDCEPDLLLLGLGSPRQEKIIYNYKKKLKSTIMIGVGGSFDVFAQKVKRAPKIFQKAGCEWLYRLMKEPSRFSRMFPILPMFLIKVIAKTKI